MCLSGNETTIIETLTALRDARELRANFKLHGIVDSADSAIRLTDEEVAYILDARINAAEARCRELGCHGPAPKADPGESQLITNKR